MILKTLTGGDNFLQQHYRSEDPLKKPHAPDLKDNKIIGNNTVSITTILIKPRVRLKYG